MTTNPAYPKGPPPAPRVVGAGQAADGVPRTVPPPLPVQTHRKVNIYAGPQRPDDDEPAAPARLLGGRYVRMALSMCRFVMYTGIPLIMLGLMACGILYVRLRHGPITVDSVVPPIENGINAELVTYKVKIDGAELRLGDRGELEFRLRDIAVKEDDGDVVASAPLAAVSISTAALWKLRIVPSRVELIDPTVNLVYTEEAGFALEVKAGAVKSVKRGDRLNADAPRDTTQVQGKQINLAKLLSDTSQRARKRLGSTSYLTEFALKNATVALNYAGQKSAWQVPEASVDFNHAKRRSVISAQALVSSPRGPWSLTVLTDETEKIDRLQIKASIRDLVPSALSGAAPPLELLKTISAPVSGDATIELSTSGNVEKSDFDLEIGAGQVVHPELKRPFEIQAGLLHLSFDGAARTWTMAPSPFKWADGSVQLSASAKDIATGGAPPSWAFAVDGNAASISAAEFEAPPISLDELYVRGTIVPRTGHLDLTDVKVKGGGGEIAVVGQMDIGTNGLNASIETNVSPMPLLTVKTLWPAAIAPGARRWIGEHITAGSFKGGALTYRSGTFVTVPNKPDPGKNVQQIDATFEISDLAFTPLTGGPQVIAPRALVQIVNNNLELNMPDAVAQTAANRTFPLKAGRMTTNDVVNERTLAEISFGAAGPLGSFLETVEQLPVGAVRDASPLPKAGDGKIDAQFKIKLPLIPRLDDGDVTVEGKAKITDGKFGKIGGQFDVQGFTLALNLTETAIDAKGDLLVNGVPAKVTGQRVFGTASDQQPPFVISAKLDDSDRSQLGLDINDLVSGVVPVEISMRKNGQPDPVIHVKADLTNAGLAIDQVAWRKAPGRPAAIEADVVNGKTYKTELQNVKITGDDISAEGWLGIGPDNKMREFHFPAFALNVVSRLEVQGLLGPDDIWNVKAIGPTFDGRDVLKSLLSVGDSAPRNASGPKTSAGSDLAVEINNVIGGGDVSMRAFKMKLSSRAGKLSALDARGTIEGGAPFAGLLDTAGGQRILKVDAGDAGQLMKLMDFYPNMQNGRLRLEVDLDGKGTAEKTGKLWVDRFRVLGDPIVSEVVSSADQGRPAISDRKRVTREVFDFDEMHARFQTGYGQFVLNSAQLTGPTMGGLLKGKVDFKLQKINLGGTYIPAQGLNGALGGIPLLGQLLSGADGEGIFGITFAVQGSTSNPQVLVNPLSLLTPGILRGMMELTPADPQIHAREERTPAKAVEQRVRASSAPAGATGSVVGPPAQKSKKAEKAVPPPPIPPPRKEIDGWSSTTNP